VQDGVGATRGELDRVEQEAEVRGGVHGDSSCCNLNRKTVETFFYSDSASFRVGRSPSVLALCEGKLHHEIGRAIESWCI
jgi:hypothetical protein